MKELIRALEVYYDNPVAFLEDMLGMECDDWQKEVASDVAGNSKVAVKSGRGREWERQRWRPVLSSGSSRAGPTQK